ncbi:2-succinyl-5-enolpyruvyl-6-hydroxy-3-cyclohexene-1-carboxylate synthase [Myxococcaceae bacterium]|nr:2-succinyl-5-enolpyruvyl-6-hydroxy-3-cyclohexene-1-carboxylate synthase [Myxococcaceae bacterium]
MADGESGLREANFVFASALLEGLVSGGVDTMCLCPGSRSTPLVAAAARLPGLRIRSHLDERSAAFFALGVARASRRPVAIVCTSGTAAANFLPAVVEANHARVPLLVLSADRPAELRDCGAGQTIDQVRLYGSNVRAFFEAPTPSPGLELERLARSLASRAVRAALGRAWGPVHLNLPFREPLEPPLESASLPQRPSSRAIEAVIAPTRHAEGASAEAVDRMARRFSDAERGVIVAGPIDRDPELAASVGRLARSLGWPILAEPISQLRAGEALGDAVVTAHHDAFLRDAAFAATKRPDLALRIGDTPTGKPLRRWLEADPETEIWLIDPDGVGHDPSRRASAILSLEPAPLCAAVASKIEAIGPRAPSALARALGRADSIAARVIESRLDASETLLTPAAVREVAASLPDAASVFLSNSMPVRDADTFWPVRPRSLRFFANRGANGIDGIVSTALGVASAGTAPLVLVSGDLAFLHDVGGLFAARDFEGSCTIVVLNDDGGGIFSFLPIAEHGESVRFRELFRLEHGIDLAPAAALYGLGFERARTRAELHAALGKSIGARGVRIIEVPIDPAENLEQHRELWRAVSAALRAEMP